MEDKTERFNLEAGDIMRVPAGTPLYLVNRDENEKLFVAALHMQPSSSSAPVNLEVTTSNNIISIIICDTSNLKGHD